MKIKKRIHSIMLIVPVVMIMVNSFLYLCTSLYSKKSATNFYYLMIRRNQISQKNKVKVSKVNDF